MKQKIINLLLCSILLTSCCSAEIIGRYPLTDEVKEILPYYTKIKTVKWQNETGSIFTGIVDNYSEDNYVLSLNECDQEEYKSVKTVLYINNESYQITVTSNKAPDFASLEIIRTQKGKATYFGAGFPVTAFTDVEYNNIEFKNVIVARVSITSYEQKESLIFYSKTNGIEYIFFEDGSWYKRVE